MLPSNHDINNIINSAKLGMMHNGKLGVSDKRQIKRIVNKSLALLLTAIESTKVFMIFMGFVVLFLYVCKYVLKIL